MTVKLKPCPFCGGKPERTFADGWHRVQCESAICSAGYTVGFCDKKRAEYAWNRRAGGKKNGR